MWPRTASCSAPLPLRPAWPTRSPASCPAHSGAARAGPRGAATTSGPAGAAIASPPRRPAWPSANPNPLPGTGAPSSPTTLASWSPSGVHPLPARGEVRRVAWQNPCMRFGLIGTGFWARTVHGPGVRDHPGSELAGVWGRDPDRTDAASAALGVRSYAELDSLLHDADAVAIAVPPDVQARLAVRAAGHGCHLLLDKPVALDLAAADQVSAAAAQAGVRAVVFHTLRYIPRVTDWLAALPADGWTGAQVRWLSSIYEPGSPYAQSVWRQDKGALWDLAPHVLSVLIPVLGAAESVVAMPGPGDQTDLIVRHASGATSKISVSLTAPPGTRGTEWRLFGSE